MRGREEQCNHDIGERDWDTKEAYEENKQKAEECLGLLSAYGKELATRFPSEERGQQFSNDIEIMADQLRLAMMAVNRRIFDRAEDDDFSSEQIKKAQNDIRQIEMMAKDLTNLSREGVAVVQAKKGERSSDCIKLDMENSWMEIRVNPMIEEEPGQEELRSGTKTREKKRVGQPRIAFDVFYKDDYIKELKKEISRMISLRIDVTRDGIYIDVDSPAIKEVLMTEENGREFPDYHVRAQSVLDANLFKRLTEEVIELLPEGIRKQVEKMIEEGMNRSLTQLMEKYRK